MAPSRNRSTRWYRASIWCCLAAFVLPAKASPDLFVGLVAVRQPSTLRRTVGGYFANFSGALSLDEEVETWSPPGDADGCQPFRAPLLADGQAPSTRPSAAVVRRGNCTFARKAIFAEAAGVAGLIIVWDTDHVQTMQAGNDSNESIDNISIFVVNVPKKVGDQMLAWDDNHAGRESVIICVTPYTPHSWDVSEVVVVAFATALVALGAFVSTADLRPGSPLAPKEEEVFDLNREMAVAFCIMGSVMLVVMFYFMRYMIYYVMFGFCMGGVGCIFTFCSLCLPYAFPSLQKVVAVLPFEMGDLLVAEIFAFVLAVVPVGGWLFFRNTEYGWIFQDLVGINVLCMMQRTLRIPNVRIATLLLGLMFFYDIFWVFLSPLLFQKDGVPASVMVEVAKGGSTGEAMPVLFRFPAISDPLGSERFLGFGDIVLPGLLVSYLLRHDTVHGKSCCRGYFVPALIGYAAGLAVTMVVLVFMEMGQPALLYLVPGTLGTTIVLGCARGELRSLWDGIPDQQQDDKKEK